MQIKIKNKPIEFDVKINIFQEEKDLLMKNDGINPCEELVNFEVFDYCQNDILSKSER